MRQASLSHCEGRETPSWMTDGVVSTVAHPSATALGLCTTHTYDNERKDGREDAGLVEPCRPSLIQEIHTRYNG